MKSFLIHIMYIRQLYFLPLLVFFFSVIAVSCDGQKDQDSAPEPSVSAVRDTMLYGLSCDGTTDSVIVFLPFTGADPVAYNIEDAHAAGRIIGKPSIGDWVAIALNPMDTTEATMVIDLDQLKGTWTYSVLPTWKDKSRMSARALRRKMAELPDSLREAYLVPREYGVTLKRSHVAQPVGYVRSQVSLYDDSPVEYPKVKRYTRWECKNGQLILGSVKNDTLPLTAVAQTEDMQFDTLDFVFMTADSLVVTTQDKRRIAFHRKASAEVANIKAQKAAEKTQKSIAK